MTFGVGRAGTTFTHRRAGVVRGRPECAFTWSRGNQLRAKPGRVTTTPSCLRWQRGQGWLWGDQDRLQSGRDGTSFGGKLVVTKPVARIGRDGWSRRNQLSRKVGLQKTSLDSDLALWRPPFPPCVRSWSGDDQEVSRTGSQTANCPRILVADRPSHRLLRHGDRGGGLQRARINPQVPRSRPTGRDDLAAARPASQAIASWRPRRGIACKSGLTA